MRKTLVTLVFSLITILVFAQQDAQFSMYMFNRLQLNPAYAGMNKTFCATVLLRQQWTGFKDSYGNDGAPKTGLVSMDYGYISKIHGGLGLTVDQDQIGFSKTLNAKLAYSFHKRLNIGTIGFGLDAGMIQQSLNAGKTGFISPDGGNSTNGGVGNSGLVDTKIPWSGSSVTTYDIGLGAYYHTNRLYIGLSSLHIPGQEVTKGTYKFTSARHYYIMAGYTFRPSPDWEITPSFLTKSVVASTQVDVNLMAKWNRAIFVGFTYRLTDAYVVMAGLEKRVNKYLTARLGYSYDITSSDIKKYSSGSHEFMLGFCYKIVPDASTTSHMNVRFL